MPKLTSTNTLPHDVRITEDGLLAQAVPLLKYSWLKHGCTTRRFSPPDANRAHELQHLRIYLGLPQETPILHAEQKHTSHVALFKTGDLENLTHDHRHVYRQTDAIASTTPGVLIAILTADCAPVFVVDTRTRAIALAHAGWKGTFARIVKKTVATLCENGSRASDLVAWVGPMISGCCYEVSPEMIEQFQQGFTDAKSAGVTFVEGRHLDLVALNAFQLLNAGVAPEAIHRSDACTLHHKDTFYSYRGDNGTTGRIISAMYVRQ